MLSLAATVTIPNLQPIVFDKDELMARYEKGFFNKWQYIAMAIEMSYHNRIADINRENFCKEWNVTEDELNSAIATIQKKKIYRQIDKQLTLELIWDE